MSTLNTGYKEEKEESQQKFSSSEGGCHIALEADV